LVAVAVILSAARCGRDKPRASALTVRTDRGGAYIVLLLGTAISGGSTQRALIMLASLLAA